MPDPEPPADLYLSKDKKLSSPNYKKRFQVSLTFNFTQYSKMTKIVYIEESFHGDIYLGIKDPN